jgi:hypothetical protein
MNTQHLEQPLKRKLLNVAALWPWLAGAASLINTGCASGASDPQRRFKGIGAILVTDAVPGVEMQGVFFTDDRGEKIYGKAVLAKRNREILALGGMRIPLTVRVVWRDNPKTVNGKDGGFDYEGPILGDYTIPVVERIPEAVLNDIRVHRGELRLKFRLKPDGVLFGWDIERPGGGLPAFFMPGGDFLDTKY